MKKPVKAIEIELLKALREYVKLERLDYNHGDIAHLWLNICRLTRQLELAHGKRPDWKVKDSP
jgi:hypothetical protein